MTTAASFTSLQAPLVEDSMEMSSPAQPSYDDDIDIDFDEHVGGVELTDDERMADDTEQPRPGTATDDMMEDDDAHSHAAQAPEQEMEDDFDPAAYEQANPDDELIDYDEDDFQEMGESNEQTVYEPPAPEITLEDREPTVEPDLEQVDEEIVREPETSVPVPEIVVAEEPVPEAVPAVTDTDAAEASAVPHEEAPPIDAPNDKSEQQAVAPEAHTAGDVTAAVDSHPEDDNNPTTPHEIEPFPELPEDSPEQTDVAPVPASLDTNVDASVDAPGTPTDTGLHPMMIQYGDWEWPLFKSSRQPEGLLKDDNLASVALADLLNNCRSRLALKAGEDISEDQEFVLRFDSTGLTIVENSPSAFSTSLEEILDVFKQLHDNDGAQSIPPFWLYLSLQPNPSSYLTMLKQAAAGGQGISSFVDVPAEEVPAHFGEYYQDGDEDPTLLGEASGIDYEEHPHNDGQDVVAETDLNETTDYHEYNTSYENTEGGQEAQEEYEEYEQYDDAEQADYEDYGEGEETNTIAAHVENPENVQTFEDTADLSPTDATDAPAVPDGNAEQSAVASPPKVVDEEEVHAGEGEGEEQGEGSNVESVASSTTLRADQANDDVGEYKDEDLIDWDGSILTSDLSEHGTDDNDDFPTFLTEPDLEENDGHSPDDKNVANEGVYHDTAAAAAEDDAAPEHHFENTDLHARGEQAAENDSEANGEFHSHDEAQKQNGVPDAVEIHTSESIGTDSLEAQPSENAGARVEQTEDQAPEATGSPLNTSRVPDDQHEHPVEEPAHDDEDYIDFGDEENLVFDEETYEQHEARKASQANSPGSQSPTSKRPLDETDGIDFNDQPDLKKVKSS